MRSTERIERLEQARSELRWFIGLRWIAAFGLLVGSISTSQFGDDNTLAIRLAVLGVAVAAYNAVTLWLISRITPGSTSDDRLTSLAVIQLLTDLCALALLSVWTGGISSPLTWLYVLHMVIASLLLRPALAFSVFCIAALLEFGGLALTDQWPQSTEDITQAVMLIALMLATVAIVNHITVALRQQRAEVRRQSERRNAILQTAADGIITIDSDGRIRSANPASETIFGYTQDEMKGRNVSVLMPEPDQSSHDQYIVNYLRTGAAKIIGVGREVVGRRKNGETFSLDLAVSEVRLGDEVFFTGILRDITERKQAEAELARLYDELKRHQDVLVQQEKMAAIGSMAAGVAHEISNPVAGMNSLVQLLRRKPERLDDKTLNQFDDLIRRIMLTVRHLTEFAHPLDVEWDDVDVNELVRNAVELLRFDHRLRRIDLQLELDPHSIQAHWMPQSIHQVMVNLINNAIDAVEETEHPRISISTRSDGQQCIIAVSDNGHGISPADLNKLFDPFFTTKPVGRGTGLGLSISYNLIRSHDGRIAVESEPNSGTRFTITLPLSCEREGPATAFPEAENTSG